MFLINGFYLLCSDSMKKLMVLEFIQYFNSIPLFYFPSSMSYVNLTALIVVIVVPTMSVGPSWSDKALEFLKKDILWR